MRQIIGNTVKTDFGDYPCANREEAEALLMSLIQRDRAKQPQQDLHLTEKLVIRHEGVVRKQ
jgi:hypothetical protein